MLQIWTVLQHDGPNHLGLWQYQEFEMNAINTTWDLVLNKSE